MEALVKGSVTALITPFTEDFKVDYGCLGALIERQIENNTKAILVAGTTGEGSTLSDREFKKIIKEAKKICESRVPLWVGAGSNNTHRASEKGKIAAEAGADLLLELTPFYNKTNDEGILRHFEHIAENVPVPIIIYNVPSRTGYDISPLSVKRLSLHPNIVGIKEASSDINKTAEIINLVSEKFYVYSGNDNLALPVLSLGGKGVVSVASNLYPEAMASLCELAEEGKFNEARKQQLSLLNVMNALFLEVNPIPVKAAMECLGLSNSAVRLPLCKMGRENLIRLKKALRDYGSLRSL